MATTGSAQDIADWQAMVRDAMRQSESLRKLIIAIGNDPDANHTIKLDLGRSQPYVFVDNIATNAIDLDDLEDFPGKPSAAHPNEISRGETIAHVLGERRYAQMSGQPGDFDSAHKLGTSCRESFP